MTVPWNCVYCRIRSSEELLCYSSKGLDKLDHLNYSHFVNFYHSNVKSSKKKLCAAISQQRKLSSVNSVKRLQLVCWWFVWIQWSRNSGTTVPDWLKSISPHIPATNLMTVVIKHLSDTRYGRFLIHWQRNIGTLIYVRKRVAKCCSPFIMTSIWQCSLKWLPLNDSNLLLNSFSKHYSPRLERCSHCCH